MELAELCSTGGVVVHLPRVLTPAGVWQEEEAAAEEADKAAKAAPPDRKRRASGVDAREGIKLARIAASGSSTCAQNSCTPHVCSIFAADSS